MRLPERDDLPGAELLSLARRSIGHGLDHRKPLPIDVRELSAALAEPAATFTTLRLAGELRGCCGRLEAAHPVAVDVTKSAFEAAFRDSRFDPVTRDEFERLRLDVSVLSPLEPFPVDNEADLLDRLTPGSDGLVIVADGRRATFLPKVWDTLPEPRRFVAQLKRKCGLPENYWSDRLEFLRYRATSCAEAE